MKKLALISLAVVLLSSCKNSKDIYGVKECKGYKDVDQLEYFKQNAKKYYIGIDSSEFEGVVLDRFVKIYNIPFKTISRYNVFVVQYKDKWKSKQIEITPVGFDIQKYHDELNDKFHVIDTLKYCPNKI